MDHQAVVLVFIWAEISIVIKLQQLLDSYSFGFLSKLVDKIKNQPQLVYFTINNPKINKNECHPSEVDLILLKNHCLFNNIQNMSKMLSRFILGVQK